MNISGIRGQRCCHLLVPYSRVSVFQSEQSAVSSIVLELCGYFDPCVNRFLCHSPEGASHLLCHFTAGTLTQFAAAPAAGAQYDSCLPNYFESSFPTVARDTVRQVSIGALV